MIKPRAVVLFGPTAVGKTELTEIIAQKSEVISADSVQVYKGFDIASAKPDEELLKKIKHHFISILNPEDQFTSGDFVREAEKIIYSLNNKQVVPVVSGGTAYYLKELIYGPSVSPKSDTLIREEVKKETDEKGLDWAYNYLKEIDIDSYNKIDRNDSYRIKRAIEVYRQTSRPLSSFKVNKEIRNDIDFLLICLVRDKKELEERIKKRVDLMFSSKLYCEIKTLFSKGANKSWPAMKSIGYKEFVELRDEGEDSLESVKEKIILQTKQYAKRQMTFFRSFDHVNYFHPEKDKDKIVSLCESFMKLVESEF